MNYRETCRSVTYRASSWLREESRCATSVRDSVLCQPAGPSYDKSLCCSRVLLPLFSFFYQSLPLTRENFLIYRKRLPFINWSWHRRQLRIPIADHRCRLINRSLSAWKCDPTSRLLECALYSETPIPPSASSQWAYFLGRYPKDDVASDEALFGESFCQADSRRCVHNPSRLHLHPAKSSVSEAILVCVPIDQHIAHFCSLPRQTYLNSQGTIY